MMKKRIVHLLITVISLLCVQAVYSQTVSAAYEAGRLIDDEVMLDAGSMNAGQIQSFLASRGGQIASKSFVMNCDVAGQQAMQAYQSAGAPCGQTTPASNIIYFTSQIYGINPKVLLATMQKEQSLITATNPTNRQYSQAMGYGCPTTGSCDDNSNFFWQIDNGTYVLRLHYERARGNMSWWRQSSTWTCGTEKNFYKPNLYPSQNVRFYDTNGTMYATVFIQNAATSSFYCYTPHTYNNPQGLYGRPPYGSTGLYYSGSYNFVLFYEQWFGSTFAYDACDSIVRDVKCVWEMKTLNGRPYFTSSIEEKRYLLSIGWTTVKRSSFYVYGSTATGRVPVYRLYSASYGSLYTRSIQERDNLASNGWQNDGIVWYAFDPSMPDNISLPVTRTDSSGGHSLYLSGEVPGNATNEGVLFKTPSGTVETPAAAPNGSVNIYRLWSGGNHFFTGNFGELSKLAKGGWTYEGVGWHASESSNSTPIHRLSGWGRHIFTANAGEKDFLAARGWTYEGIGWYAKDDVRVYRLASKDKHFFTANMGEAAILLKSGYWTYEGLISDQTSGNIPVLRLSSSDAHFFTKNVSEAAALIRSRYWQYEGIAWHASPTTNTSPVYRLSGWGRHMFTANAAEKDFLASHGWTYESIGWYDQL